MLGAIAMTMFAGITWLAVVTKVKVAETTEDLIGMPPGTEQKTVIAQVAQAVFSNFTPMFVFVSVVTALILVLAANTAFNGFPVLGSILARDGYLPRQLHTRGDRLAFSNGIVTLAGLAGLLIYVYEANVSALIQLYIIGVFVSFTLSQLGMIRHWNRHLSDERDPAERGRMKRKRLVNGVGFCMTGTVLVIVLVTKFTQGAWIVVIAMPVLFLHHGVDPQALRPGLGRAGGRRRRERDAAQPGARDRAGLQGPQADAAGAGLRAGDPARPSSRRSPWTSTTTAPRG